MLSNKMTFSLMSLITILALAFVTSSAVAGDFTVKIMGRSAVAYMLAEADDNTTADIDESAAYRVQLVVESDKDLATDFPMGITVYATDKDGIHIPEADATTTPPITGYMIAIEDDRSWADRTQKKRRVNVDITIMTNDATPREVKRVVLTLPTFMTPDPTVAVADSMSKQVQHTITLSMAVDVSDVPKVVSIQRLRPGSQTVVAAFQEARIAPEAFNVRIVLTAGHTADPLNAVNLVEVENGTASALVVGKKFAWFGGMTNDTPPMVNPLQTVRPHPGEGMYYFDNMYAPLQGTERISTDMSDTVPMPTSADDTNDMYSQYRVTITPHQKSADFDIKVKVKDFNDGGASLRRTYVSPGFGDSAHLPNGRDILTIPVKGAARNLEAGYRVTILEKQIIPAGGYLIIARDVGGSAIEAGPGPAGAWRTDDTPRGTHRTPAQLLYNVYGTTDLPNLATAFLNGVVVDVESQHPLVISEVMWGEDVSLDTSSNSQYIELYNPGAQYKTINDADHTPDINEALTLIFYAPNEFSAVPARDAAGALPTGITDRIGTLDAKGTYWSPAGKGQSGRSGTEMGTEGRATFGVIVPIVSMYRVIEEGVAVLSATNDGQAAASWSTSDGPKSTNFDPVAIGIRHGTPGAATDATTTPADTEAEAKAKADKDAAAAKKTESTGTYPKAGEGKVYISEIMVAGDGILPQWIEISNGDRSAGYNLSGWTLTVANAAADADVSVGALATFTIPDGTTIDPSERHDPIGANTPSTILVVTEVGRNNLDASGQVINLMKDNEVDLINAGVTKRKYTLLSDMAFSITLAPPEPKATKPPKDETAAAKAIRSAAETKDKAERKAATDMVGNLGADGAAAWALPMSEDDRSSLIRRHVQVKFGPAEPEDGTMMDNWVLASDTQTKSIRAETYYGAQNDVGTPGFRAGGALPVELSHFRPARDKVTDAVVITWSTQSELNNAGFFIKRSQQRDGEFKVINATMIQGAGTSSEKQFYTYQDTTAQPNVVYYYQIEDVSLDGNRQTLTNGIRLKGHVSVAGKLTTLWGDLKTLQ